MWSCAAICGAHNGFALPIMHSDQAPIFRDFVLNIEPGSILSHLNIRSLSGKLSELAKL